jgi:uncharacterized protein (TIGR02996 family)
VGELDHSALAEALERGSDEDFAAASRKVGVAWQRSELAALVERCNDVFYDLRGPKLAFVLAHVQRALDGEHGLSYERVEARGAFVHCLVARWSDGGGKPWITIGLERVYRGRTVESAWPSLAPWSKRLEENRARIEAWAKTPILGVLRFALTGEPRPTAPASPTSAAEEAEMIRAIVESPDDDAPRLVYADWLLERGDVRGELIALSCNQRRTVDVERRIRDILDASFASLAGDAAPYTEKGWFDRGFVARVRMTVAAFAKHGEALMRSAPITSLVVANPRPTAKDLAKLAATPALGGIRTLSLSHAGGTVAPAPLAPLAESPHLGRLRRLELSGWGASADDWAAFFGRLRAPMLEEVWLHDVRSSTAIHRALARNAGLGRVRSFEEQRQTDLDAPDEDDVANAFGELAEKRTSLERLALTNRPFTEAAVRPFFASSGGAALRSLFLADCAGGDAIASLLAGSRKAQALSSLSLLHAEIGPRGVEALLASPSLRALEVLDVIDWRDEWTAASADAIARALLDLPADRALRRVLLPQPDGYDQALRARLAERFEVER